MRDDAGATQPLRDANLSPRALVAMLLADPPAVHPMDASANPTVGVWASAPECYEFLAANCPPGTRTLETGCGVSTALFAACGARHHCVSPGTIETAAIVEYCHRLGIATDDVSFDVAFSHVALPAVHDEIDLLFIDGCHGWPMPVVDWFYGGSLLRRGGLLVVDDANLPAVRSLTEFLDADPRWTTVQRDATWGAYRRESEGSLLEDWVTQPFYPPPPRGLAGFLARARGKVRHELRRRRR